MFSDKVKLRAAAVNTDDDGYVIKTYAETEVWANIKTAGRAEFYSAYESGINVSLVVEVHVEDYGDEMQISTGGKIYDVVRAYRKGNGVVALTCSDKAV